MKPKYKIYHKSEVDKNNNPIKPCERIAEWLTNNGNNFPSYWVAEKMITTLSYIEGFNPMNWVIVSF